MKVDNLFSTHLHAYLLLVLLFEICFELKFLFGYFAGTICEERIMSVECNIRALFRKGIYFSISNKAYNVGGFGLRTQVMLPTHCETHEGSELCDSIRHWKTKSVIKII